MKDFITRRFRFLNGEECLLDSRVLELSSDTEADRQVVASLYFRVSHYLGLAKRELEHSDAQYRNWRAATALDNPKSCSSEPKTKVYLESLEKFVEWKKSLASLQERVNTLEGYQEALDMKSRQLIAKSREDNASANRTPTYSFPDREERFREGARRMRRQVTVEDTDPSDNDNQ